MKLRKLNHLLLTVLMLLVSQRACPQGVPTAQSSKDENLQEEQGLESLVSTDGQVRLDATVKLDKQRRQLVQKLIAILDSTNSVNLKLDAIIVLGEYRAVEAVPILVRHLEWDDTLGQGDMHPIMTKEAWEEASSPVSTALQEIGMPAIPALLDKITETDDLKITTKCVTICKRIEGSEVTQFRLQGLSDKETDPKNKERIQAALDALKKLNPAK